MTAYAELAVTTNFSFLRGTSHAEELVAEAVRLGLAGIGIADRNTVAGVVRAHAALRHIKEASGPNAFKLVVGARLVFTDGTPDILAYPATRAGWGNLCRLLTVGKLRAGKGECKLHLSDLMDHLSDLLLIVLPSEHPGAETITVLDRLLSHAPASIWLGAAMLRRGPDRRRLTTLRDMAARAGVPLIAVNDVLYHAPERRALQDIVTCIRDHVTLEAAGRVLEVNAERHLKPADEMARLFADCPEAIAETTRFLARITFSLDELAYHYPDEPVPPGRTAQEHLEALTWAGASARYPAPEYRNGVPDSVRQTLARELALIADLNYAPYFLTVHDIVAFARARGILCQGRGSAANSAVCYVLGITGVNPMEVDLLFERFISPERREPPDIDVDFEHERREEVIQYIYARYGRHRAGIAATVISYRPRSAIRDVGKALGLTEDVTAALASTVWGSWGDGLAGDHVRQAGLDPDNPVIARAIRFATELMGFPRHLSQHVGGFVLTADRLDETVPVGNAAMAERTFIEWDKDDLDTLGLLKVDVLSLGMLTCIRKAFDLIREHGGPKGGDPDLSLATLPREDKAVYAMLSKGDSLGVFQVESRAQMNMLPRLRPQCFYDLVIEVAIVRPGPIQGDMVHPYLRRRQGIEPVDYPAPAPEHGHPDELKRVLGKTLGVPLFQEQAMRIAMVAAGFTGAEANQLRRAMATFRHVGTIHTFEHKMVGGMVARGYDPDFAARCFKQIEGFGTYGFPESHAAAFAHLVYVSAWLKCHHPAAFAAALLNSQPMGFYAPAQIVRDAREHGVHVRAIDVNASGWDNTLERGKDNAPALRLGLRQIDGFREDWAEAIVNHRTRPYEDMEDLARRTRLPRRALEHLANADALRSLGLDRRNALWAARRLPDDDPLPLFAAAQARELGAESDADLPQMPLSEHVVADYQTLRLSLKAHPMSFLRPMFTDEGIVSCLAATNLKDGSRVRTAGVVLVRQRPGSAKGVIFITIEDETGVANLVVWPDVTAKYRREIMGAHLLMVKGRVQRSAEGVVHIVAETLTDRTADLHRLSEQDMRVTLSNADEILHPQHPRTSNHPHAKQPRAQHPRDVRVIPKSRDFH